MLFYCSISMWKIEEMITWDSCWKDAFLHQFLLLMSDDLSSSSQTTFLQTVLLDNRQPSPFFRKRQEIGSSSVSFCWWPESTNNSSNWDWQKRNLCRLIPNTTYNRHWLSVVLIGWETKSHFLSFLYQHKSATSLKKTNIRLCSLSMFILVLSLVYSCMSMLGAFHSSILNCFPNNPCQIFDISR